MKLGGRCVGKILGDFKEKMLGICDSIFLYVYMKFFRMKNWYKFKN